MTPYSSFQLPDLTKPFLNESETGRAVRQYWLSGYDRMQQNWLRSACDLFAHYDVLLREGQSLQNTVLTHYLEWTKGWAGTSTGVENPVVVKPVAKATPVAASPAAKPVAPAPKVPVKDDLTRIRGVGKVVQQRLNEAGVVSFRQVATWTDTDIAHIENDVLGGRFSGRISRDQWPSQAREFLEEV